MRVLCLFIFSLFLTACSKGNFPDYSEHEPFALRTEEGVFEVKYVGLNPHLTDDIKGNGILSIQNVQLDVKLLVDTNLKNETIQQFVHQKSFCPTSRDDLNGDGEIDLTELEEVSGQGLFALDNDIKSEVVDLFPRTDKQGNYRYRQVASVFLLLETLHRQGLLQDRERLDLDERTIVLYKNYLPIACAEIRRAPRGD